MKSVQLAYHEFTANCLFDDHDLNPFFAADSQVKEGGGSQVAEFTDNGERWMVKLYYQDSGLVHPGNQTPQGTDWRLNEMREFRLSVKRHPDEDGVAVLGGDVKQKFNAHIAPRWQGMEAEDDDGERFEINVPEGVIEAVNVKLSGSNIRFDRYQELLQSAADAVGITARYFENPHPYSNITDAERYVRLHRDSSGPIHARGGPIAELSHLLENDRSGYRKLVQNDDDEHGRGLPGYYHTVTLGSSRIQDAFPDHDLPKEIKHYYSREANSKNADDALAHPKLGASYQVSRWDGTLGFDELEKLNHELTQTVLSVLTEAGIDIAPMHGTGAFVDLDAYWSPDLTEDNPAPLDLDLTEIRHEQESVVIRHLADGGFSPVEWEAMEQLVTDGGVVAPKDIAEDNDRNLDSVYRALDRLEEMVDRKYGEVALRSDYVSQLVHDAVKDAREQTRRAVETAAKAKQTAERGASQVMEEFVAWCSRYGVDISNRSGALDVDLGERDPETDAPVSRTVQSALEMWKEANQDPERFLNATIHFQKPGDVQKRRIPAWKLLR